MAVFICQGCGAEHTSWDGKCPACGTTETIRLNPNTDRMIDRVIKSKFKILKKLGQGGMGAVYLAEQVGIGHRVALKFLKSEFSADAEIARRFLNEAKSYARVAHPNAVALHDFGQDDDGNLFIAMEYCEGVDLKKVIAEQGRLELVEAIEVVLQVADVLANAHTKGVIHRDLKPENIMIRRGMRGVHAKVLDFGIARLMDNGTQLTVAGAIAGTPRYMSPEQVEGRPVDLRADIYSLGIVLFETLTGRQPFDGNTIAEILRKQAVEPMPHLTEFANDRDYPELDAVIQRASAKKRDDRWPDMLTFAQALSQATPTAAHLGLSPLQRSSVHRAMPGMATPVPSVGNSTPSSMSGLAVPGAAIDGSSTEQTMMKTEERSAVKRPLATDAAHVVPIQLQQPLQLNTQTQQAGELSMSQPPVAPTSKAPMIAAVAVVGVLLIGAGVLFMPKQVDPPVVKPPVVVTDPVKPPDPVVKNVDPGAAALAAEVRQTMREETAKANFSRGSAEFEVANFDDAISLLGQIPQESALHDQAQLVLEKIKTIRETLASAERERGTGHCERATPMYRKVLALNSRVKDAAAGLNRCTEAQVNPTMDP